MSIFGHEGTSVPEPLFYPLLLADHKTWFTPTQGVLLVIDDLMRSCRNDELVVDIFTKH